MASLGEGKISEVMDAEQEDELFTDDSDREMAEELREQVKFAQKAIDDRTLIYAPKKKVEQQHSSLHLLWGTFLLLIVMLVKRLPRYPGGKALKPIADEDTLMSWESKQLIGDNKNEGLLKRLYADSQASVGFRDFALLSKDSRDRREKWGQRTYAFQKQLVQVMNPVLVVTDRLNSVLHLLPPQSGTIPPEADELREELERLSEVELKASERKAAFLSEWSTTRLENEYYSDRETYKALRRLMKAELEYMHKASAILEFQIHETLKVKGRGPTAPRTVQKELQALESQAKLAAKGLTRQVAACMDALPTKDQWLLLLFVEHLPRPSTKPSQ